MKIIWIVILCVIAYSVFFTIRDSWKRKSIPKKSTDHLRKLFSSRRNYTQFHQALLELKQRGEDTNFALPHLIDLATCKVSVMELIGKGCLESHFKDELGHINFSHKKWTPEDRTYLQELKNKLS